MTASGDFVTKRLVQLTYGNTHERIYSRYVRDGSGETNLWAMELLINDEQGAVGKYIKSVTYTLHSMFE